MVQRRDEVAPPLDRYVADGNEVVRKPRVKRRPNMPTKADIDAHLLLHLQYRAWCAHCVAGKGTSDRHMATAEGEEALGVTWHSDYCFMKEEAEVGMQPCLVCYDQSKDAFWAMGVDAKGPTPTVVKWMVERINMSGYRGEQLTMKSDNEDSVIALQKATAAMRSGETVLIHSPVRSSKSNGRMENSVRRWQGQLRTIKHFTESRIKRKIPP